MIGNVTQQVGRPLPEKNSQIYMLDVRSYTWVYTFDAPTTTSTNTSVNSNLPNQTSTTTSVSESNNTLKVAIGTISGILGTIILIAVGFFGYKYNQRRQREKPNIMRVHGNAL